MYDYPMNLIEYLG